MYSNWIHIRPRSRSRAKFNNEKTFAAIKRTVTVVAACARSSTTERQPDCFYRMAYLQSGRTFASNVEESSKSKNLECFFKDGQHPVWTCEKLKSMKINGRREQVQKLRLCFYCLKPGHMSKDYKRRTCGVPKCGRQHNRLLRSDLPKNVTTKNVSDATTAVASSITVGGIAVVLIKLTNID